MLKRLTIWLDEHVTANGLDVDHYWIVDREAQRLEASEREGDVYR